jgi:hypothetical protein
MTLYGNTTTERIKIPVKAGGRMINGKIEYCKGGVSVVGYDIYEQTFDVNPAFPEDKVFLSSKRIKRVFNN